MLSEKLRECGVVGAGGAGFPTYVKAQSQVEFFIANGAKCGKFGIKTKNQESLEALRHSLQDARIEFVMLGDFYPSGDEYELVYTATGRLIPPAGIPLQVGCVVNNVHLAEQGTPVTQKFLSVCGAVQEAKSLWAPVGTPFRDVLAMAGGATVSDFGIFVSGIMMGTLTFDPDDVVT